MTASVTVERISTPSMPKSWNPTEASSPWRMFSDSAKIGASQSVIRLAPRGRPRNRPMKMDGIASRISGIVMTGGDSWIRSQISRGPRKLPQNVRPMSRNM